MKFYYFSMVILLPVSIFALTQYALIILGSNA